MARVSSILAALARPWTRWVAVLALIVASCVTPRPRLEYMEVAPFLNLRIALELQPEQMSRYDGALDFGYILPSQKQLDRIHKYAFRPSLAEMDGHDCDDISLEYMVRARTYAYRTFVPTNAALACGVLFIRFNQPLPELGFYEVPPGVMQYHALNVYLRNDGEWIVVEPQTGKQALWKTFYYEGSFVICKVMI